MARLTIAQRVLQSAMFVKSRDRRNGGSPRRHGSRELIMSLMVPFVE
jgi:hypothetical protein